VPLSDGESESERVTKKTAPKTKRPQRREYLIDGWVKRRAIFIVSGSSEQDARIRCKDGDWNACEETELLDYEMDGTTVRLND
jgi:hypothetical protein